jgi:hypothetical protein
MVRRMRVRSALYFVPASLLAFACADDLPTYPAVTIINVGVTGGGSSNGNGNGNGTSGNHPVAQGGDAAGGDGTGATSTSGSMNSGLYPHCDEFQSGDDPPVGSVTCDLDNLVDGGLLTGDISGEKTLESGHFYTLRGATRIMPGAKLVIPPCVKVIGQDSTAVLAARPGDLGDPLAACIYDKAKKPGPSGQLIAIGEPMAPIIFTSGKPVGERRPGDWGGVILAGNAQNNKATAGYRVPVEGLTRSECHGWATDEFNDESSGHLEYVRIEYGSRQISADSETNGLTLASCGSKTELHYVMVSNSADDCFEWFGGIMNADHLIALNCEDDMFDADDGFSGHVQFMFGRQFPTTTESDSSGFEIDTGVRSGNALIPSTSASFSNFAICGAGPSDTDNRRVGAAFRASATPDMKNGFITEFAGNATRVITSSTPTAGSIRAWDNPESAPAFNPPGDAPLGGLSAEPPDRFCGCFSNPPSPIGATPLEGLAPAFGDKTATYIGAFKDSKPESNWMRGLWVSWADK